MLSAESQYFIQYNFLFFLVLITAGSYWQRGAGVSSSCSKIPALLLFLFMVLIIGCRDWASPLFGDSATYGKYLELEISPDSVWYAKSKLFGYIYYYCHICNLSPESFFLLSAVIYCAPMYALSKQWKNPRSPYLPLLFFATSFIWYSFGVNGIRNGWAFAMILWAIYFYNRPVLFYLFLALGYLLHGSVMLTIGAICVSRYFTKPKIALLFWLGSILLSVSIGRYMENVFLQFDFIADEGESYLSPDDGLNDEVEFSHTGFRWDFVLYSVIPIIWGYYNIKKSQIRDKYYDWIFCSYVLANAIWVLVIRANYSNRIASLSWFLIPLVVAYPLLRMHNFRNRNQTTAIVLLLYYGFSYGMWILT